MFRVVRCTLHRHCHHCHCHYQKCWCRIHLLCFLQSNGHPILYHLATCISQQVLKIVIGTMLVVVVVMVVVVFGGFAASEEKRLHIGNNSQEMPHGDDYKDFLKNNLNKVNLIRLLNEFMKRQVLRLRLDYSLVITLEKEACEISLTGFQNLSPCNHKEADIRIMYHCT